MKTIVLVLLLLPCCAFAGDVVVGYAPFCYHFSGAEDMNERNNHAFLLSVNQWFGMTFRNSHYNRSYSVGYEFMTPKIRFGGDVFLRGTLPAGLVYGYGGIKPAAAGVVEVGRGRGSVKMMFIPVDGGVASAMFCWRF